MRSYQTTEKTHTPKKRAWKVFVTQAENQTEITDYNHAHRGTSHITASVFIIIFPRSSIVTQSCTEYFPCCTASFRHRPPTLGLSSSSYILQLTLKIHQQTVWGASSEIFKQNKTTWPQISGRFSYKITPFGVNQEKDECDWSLGIKIVRIFAQKAMG
jgi:hypothetical protein